MQPLVSSFNLASAAAANALLASVWEGAILALAVALSFRLLPRATANLRSVVWTAVLVIVAALPLRPLLDGPAPHSTVATASGLHHVAIDTRWAVALVCLWALLSVARLTALLRSAIRLRQIARGATAIAVDPKLQALLHDGQRHIELCLSVDIDRPCVLGLRSPRILLPPALFETLSAPELTHVVLHEMQHLSRRDLWLNPFQKLSLALFPLNPVLLWIERRICLERELACDDGVLRVTHARKTYATCLTNLAEHAMVRRSLSLALGAWEKHSELARRVERILRLPELPDARPELVMGRARTALVTGTLLVGITGGATVLARSPQLITFASPSPAAVSRELAATEARLDLSSPSPSRQAVRNTHPHLVETAIKLDPPARLARIPATTPRASSLLVKARVRHTPQRPATQLTDFHANRPAPRVIFTAIHTSEFSYAAVPWLNGWLIVQL